MICPSVDHFFSIVRDLSALLDLGELCGNAGRMEFLDLGTEEPHLRHNAGAEFFRICLEREFGVAIQDVEHSFGFIDRERRFDDGLGIKGRRRILLDARRCPRHQGYEYDAKDEYFHLKKASLSYAAFAANCPHAA